MSTEKIMRAAERFLKRTKEYMENRDADDNYTIDFVLFKGNAFAPEDVIASASCVDFSISLKPLHSEDTSVTHDWTFNFDDDLFGMLESGYKIAGMTMDCHFCVWHTIGESQRDDIENPKGMQMYLSYCKRNGITAQELKVDTSYDGVDVMTLYEKSSREQER